MAIERPHDLTRPLREFITPVDTTLQADYSVGEAMAALRARQPQQAIIYFYVIDTDNRLVGIVPTRRLLLSDPARPIREVMHSHVVSLKATDTLEVALEEFAMHRLLALPVVDAEGHLLGAIDVRLYAEEVFDLAEARGANDLFQFIGLSVEQARQGTAASGFRLRMPWLMCNMLSGVLCAVIAAVFQDVLATVVLLAMFIPLVLTLSESVSMQSMTIGLQFLHRPGVPWRAVKGRAVLEWKTALYLGVVSGVLVGAASLFWGGGSWPATGAAPPAAVLAAAIVVSMLCAAMVGLGVPVLLHAGKLEPRVAAGPVVLMVADVVTTAAYLGLATWWLL